MITVAEMGSKLSGEIPERRHRKSCPSCTLISFLLVMCALVATLILRHQTEPTPPRHHSWIENNSVFIFVDGSQITCNTTNSEIHSYHVLWKNEKLTGTGKVYWTVKISEGPDVYVGITDERNFIQGRKNAALLYVARMGILGYDRGPARYFGPRPLAGDVIGMVVSAGKMYINVYFYINGRCLGRAYTVPRRSFGDVIYPTAQFTEAGGSASIKRMQGLPSTFTRDDGLIGKWKYNGGGWYPWWHISVCIAADGPGAYRATFNVDDRVVPVSIRKETKWGPLIGKYTGSSPPLQMSPRGWILEDVRQSPPYDPHEDRLKRFVEGATFEVNEAGDELTIGGTRWSRARPT